MREEHEVYELLSGNQTQFHIDPVCKMQIDHKRKAIPHPNRPNIFFCHEGCLETYLQYQFN